MDQNTTTIIAAFIGGGSTLTVALLSFVGGFFSNRSTAKLEKLKIREEKRNRDTNTVKEVCHILSMTDYLVDTFAYEVKQKINLNPVERVKEIRRSSMNTKVLIRVYLPSLMKNSDEYENNLEKYWNAIAYLHSGKQGETRNHAKEMDKYKIAEKEYKSSLLEILIELERLVKLMDAEDQYTLRHPLRIKAFLQHPSKSRHNHRHMAVQS